MEENTDSGSNGISGFALSGDAVDVEEGKKLDRTGESGQNIQETKKTPLNKDTVNKAFVGLIKLPYGLVSSIRDKTHWKLTDEETKEIEDSSRCFTSNIPEWLFKSFCLITFLFTMLRITFGKIKRDRKEDNNEEEEEEENEDEDKDERPGKVLGKGVRNE